MKRRSRRGRTCRARSDIGQTSLYGEVLTANNSDVFGHYFPKYPDKNCSIITFQNIGQQPKTIYKQKA